MREGGKILMWIGGIVFAVGIVIWLWGDKFKWFGSLPGDIRVRKPGFSLFIPITSMILVSVCLSLVLWLVRKFFS
jgi:hypothetical protein